MEESPHYVEIDTETATACLASCPPGTFLFRSGDEGHSVIISFVTRDRKISHQKILHRGFGLSSCGLEAHWGISGDFIKIYYLLRNDEVKELLFDEQGGADDEVTDVTITRAPIPSYFLETLKKQKSSYLGILPLEIINLLVTFLHPFRILIARPITPSELARFSEAFKPSLSKIVLSSTALARDDTPPEPARAFFNATKHLPALTTLKLDLCDKYSSELINFIVETMAPLRNLHLSFVTGSRKQANFDPSNLMLALQALPLSCLTIETFARHPPVLLANTFNLLKASGLQELCVKGGVAVPLTDLHGALNQNLPLQTFKLVGASFDSRNVDKLLQALKKNTHLMELRLPFAYPLKAADMATLLLSNRTLEVLSVDIIEPGYNVFGAALKSSSLTTFCTSPAAQLALSKNANGALKFDTQGAYRKKPK